MCLESRLEYYELQIFSRTILYSIDGNEMGSALNCLIIIIF